ncbi:tripartite motif-containing protein 14 isoform X1 [Anas platyrhynchos]|uniref:tripartite motif-containing protein 14 isoform X1 n=1 Tax=Anas platyrhynchos TaxID=8839 RepID=UPI003AF20D77
MALGEPRRGCGAHAGRPLELLCEDCGRCVCALCPALGPHRGHRACLLHHAARHRQELLTLCLKDLEERKEQEAGNRRCIEQAANDLKAHAAMTKKQLSDRMTELQLLLREEESLARNLIDEKTQQALEAHGQQMESCQEKLAALDTFSYRIREMQQNNDIIQFLEKSIEIEKELQESKSQLEQCHPIPLSFEHVLNYYKHLMTGLQSVLQKPLEVRLKEDVFSSLNATTKKEPGTMLKTMSPVDRLLFLKHARSPTWEYDSLHPRLKLSDDRLVAGTGWWIGAAYPSIGRKGDSETCRLGWNRASWCIKRFDFEYWAFHKGERIPLTVEDDPDRVGVFLDYEAGILSFYNVTDGMAHLHTFRCKFTEPVYPALRLWEGSIGTCKLT